MGFTFIAWGLVFVLLSFKIQEVDILPDIVGYILIFIGLSKIEHYHSNFRKAKMLSVVFIVLSLIGMFQIRWTNPDGVFIAGGVLLGLVFLVLQLCLFYFIFIGMEEGSRNRGLIELSTLARRRWTQYFLFTVLIFISMLIIWMAPILLGSAVAFIGFILSIVLTYLMVTVCMRAEREWSSMNR